MQGAVPLLRPFWGSGSCPRTYGQAEMGIEPANLSDWEMIAVSTKPAMICTINAVWQKVHLLNLLKTSGLIFVTLLEGVLKG